MPEADLRLLLDAAEEAGRIAAHYFRNDPDVRDKGDGQGPVSEADVAVNAMLERDLRAARPDYGWLSEESVDTADRLGCDHVFIVDPIDGTRSFIDGKTTFSHSLAVARKGQITAAVVFLPMEDKLFAAAHGSGATLNGAPIGVSSSRVDGLAQVLTTRSNMKPDLWPGGVPEVERHFRSSIAYRLSLVGQGRFDGMITLRDAWEWDIAAGALIVTEAGGRISDRSGHALRFNNAYPKTPGVIAAGDPLHADLISRL